MILILPVIFLGVLAVGGLLTVGATRLGNSEVRRLPRLNQPVRIARNDEFIPQSIPQYLEQQGSPVTQGLTNIINEHRRQTPNGPLFICLGETHGHNSRMLGSISEFFQNWSRSLTAEQRENVIVTLEIPHCPTISDMPQEHLGQFENMIQGDPNIEIYRIFIAARRAGLRVAFVDSRFSGNGNNEQANARETEIYNNISRLIQGRTNPVIFYYGGAWHCSKTSNTAVSTLAMRLASTHGDNSVISIRSVDRMFGFDGVAQSTPNIDTIIPPGSNPVIVPIGGPIRNGNGTYDYIITSPSVRR